MESTEKDGCIKHQEEHIAKLQKKLDKEPRASSNKGASSDDDEKGPIEARLLRMMAGQRRATSHKMTHL